MSKPCQSKTSSQVNKSHLHLRAGASVAGFIVDFHCPESALVVEVNGDIHGLQHEEDMRREKILRELGSKIVRFRKDEVVKNLILAAAKIRELILIIGR